jgi:two-component system response regulator HydG
MNRKLPKILVVDDDPASLALAKATLLQGNFENIDTFLNPLEAQKAYQKNQYDLLLTDLRMPDFSGFDIIAQIGKKQGPKPKIIVLTAQAEADSAQQALNLGAQKVFFKPYNVAELLEEVERLLLDASSQADTEV